MHARPLAIPDLVEIVPTRHRDSRGYFAETFREDWFSEHVASVRFVQENQSLSRQPGLVRGLHFQREPHAQGKLVRCLAGAIFDVAVDLRPGTETYGRSVAVTLSAEAGNQLWIPAGFAHGFCTLTPDALVSYRVTAYYSAAHDAGIAWNDPDLAIAWPDLANPASLSAKDQAQPRLRDLPAPLLTGDAA
jgi:dTDP-4-dehydrorhamnose 3,5-epimerase